MLAAIIVLLFLFLFLYLFASVFSPILWLKSISNNAKKDNLSEFDFSKEREYYRDIIEGYSPLELSYVDNLEIEGKREIIATLISLELKKELLLMKMALLY